MAFRFSTVVDMEAPRVFGHVDEVIAWAARRFGERFRHVKVGEPIVVQAP